MIMHKLFIKLFAVIVVIALLMINIQIDIPSTSSTDQINFAVNFNEALASLEEDMRMKEETCWNTGERIQICRVDPEMICDVAAQDAC
jgi:hypothetical protein